MPNNAAPAAPKKGISIWVWLIGGFGLMIVMGGLLMIVLGLLVVRTAKNAVRERLARSGVTTDELQKNPAFVGTRMALAMNPDVEIISSDANAGTITFKDKKQNKTITMNINDINQGKWQVTETDANGKTTSATVGLNAAKAPDWLPLYPGGKQEGLFSSQTDEKAAGTFQIKTSDKAEKLFTFYEDALKKGGFDCQTQKMEVDGKKTFVLTATNNAAGRTANIVVSDADGTVAIVTYETKN